MKLRDIKEGQVEDPKIQRVASVSRNTGSGQCCAPRPASWTYPLTEIVMPRYSTLEHFIHFPMIRERRWRTIVLCCLLHRYQLHDQLLTSASHEIYPSTPAVELLNTAATALQFPHALYDR
jgi:hypothetical protein